MLYGKTLGSTPLNTPALVHCAEPGVGPRDGVRVGLCVGTLVSAQSVKT